MSVDPPSWSAAAHTRNLASAGLRITYRIDVHGAHHVGTSGPLLLVTACEGVLASMLLHGTAPRPLHVVANAAMMSSMPGKARDAAGDIAVAAPTAVEAQRRALAALADERAVAVAGSLCPVGYLVAKTDVAVMPVVLLGADGRVPTDPPRPRTRIDVYYAPPVRVEVVGDPLEHFAGFLLLAGGQLFLELKTLMHSAQR